MRNTLSSRLVAVGIGLAALVGFAPSAQTADYYVNNAGDDSNPGSKEKPWKSLDKVSKAQIQPGETVFFKAGNKFEGALEIHFSGTVNAPITFTSYDGPGQAMIVGTIPRQSAIYLNSADSLNFENLDISAPGSWGILMGGTGTGTSNTKFKKLKIHNCGNHGFAGANPNDRGIVVSDTTITDVGGNGVYFCGQDLTLENNKINIDRTSQTSKAIELRNLRKLVYSNNEVEGVCATLLDLSPVPKEYSTPQPNFWRSKKTVDERFYATKPGENPRSGSLMYLRQATKNHKSDIILTPSNSSILMNRPQPQPLPNPFTNRPAYQLPGQPQNTATNAPTVETPFQRFKRLQMQQKR